MILDAVSSFRGNFQLKTKDSNATVRCKMTMMPKARIG